MDHNTTPSVRTDEDISLAVRNTTAAQRQQYAVGKRLLSPNLNIISK